jgi:hypothetical protein
VGHSFDILADAVREQVVSAAFPLAWSECHQLLRNCIDETPSWILALPVLCCLAVGGSQVDGVKVSAGWLALNQSLHLLDAVEDGDFAPDEIVDKAEKALNLSTALIFMAYDFFSDLQSAGASQRVVKVCSECGFRATQGQHMGFDPFPAQIDEAINTYWQATILKSGSLFRMACAGGAAAGTDAQAPIEALGIYGTSIGVILQVLDDCRDMVDARTGKQETSLPALLYSVASGRQEIIYPDSRSSLEGTDVPETISTALSAWWQRASDSLKSLPQSEAVELLHDALQALLSVPKPGKTQ